ncbi:MAG: hypothetical protein C0497_14685 [Gemmatimonas sp.]|nr:hypothetical protein [Gemmatimonas sp.]
MRCSHALAFVEYPGSTHLRLETTRDLIVDIVRSPPTARAARWSAAPSVMRSAIPAVRLLS